MSVFAKLLAVLVYAYFAYLQVADYRLCQIAQTWPKVQAQVVFASMGHDVSRLIPAPKIGFHYLVGERVYRGDTYGISNPGESLSFDSQKFMDDVKLGKNIEVGYNPEKPGQAYAFVRWVFPIKTLSSIFMSMFTFYLFSCAVMLNVRHFDD